MKFDRIITFLIFGSVAIAVLASELPKLLGPAAAILAMVVIGRLVWFYTRRW